MPEQLSFKAKSIFASKKRQHNFRSYFTLPKSLKFKCAEILVNKIFVPIASELEISKIIPSSLPKNSPILPLGLHTEWPPVSDRICDMPGCLDRYSVENPGSGLMDAGILSTLTVCKGATFAKSVPHS